MSKFSHVEETDEAVIIGAKLLIKRKVASSCIDCSCGAALLLMPAQERLKIYFWWIRLAGFFYNPRTSILCLIKEIICNYLLFAAIKKERSLFTIEMYSSTLMFLLIRML